MAARHRTHPHRHDEAQPADQHSDDPVQARAQTSSAKEAARYREHTALTVDDRTTPERDDRQEVA